jgi:hypothetical protein
MEYKWNKWMERLYYTDDGEKYTVTQWMESFIHEGLVPEMKKCGYAFPTNENHIVNSFLNFLFHFENSYDAMTECQYIGKHGRKMSWSQEDYIYFLDYKCPLSVWEKLRKKFPIEHFSDMGDFADRLWIQIPSTVFFMVDLAYSMSSNELQSRIAWLDSDEEEGGGGQQKKRNKVDPYLLDYGKDRYKYTESDTRI